MHCLQLEVHRPNKNNGASKQDTGALGQISTAPADLKVQKSRHTWATKVGIPGPHSAAGAPPRPEAAAALPCCFGLRRYYLHTHTHRGNTQL